jgi:hypothetical protein
VDSLTTIANKIDKRAFVDHSWITDLIYYEGPIVSLYKGSQNQDYFYYWCENDALINRWLVIPVDRNEITLYINNDVTLYSLVQRHQFSVMLDTNSDGDITIAYSISAASLPEKYLPPVTSYFDVDLCPSESYRQMITSSYVIDIDKRWFFDEFSEVEKIFTQLYSFMYAVSNVGGIVSNEKIKHTFEQYPWRGGFSAVNFYNDLRSSVPSFHEPEVESIVYASPGTIKLELFAPVAISTGEILNHVFSNPEMAKNAYDDARKYLKQTGLLKIDATAHYDALLTDATIATIADHLTDLGRAMRIEPLVEKIKVLAGNELVAIKIILSFYRRVVKLNKYQFGGKLTFNKLD